ncbi:MAG: ECF transporter S component [Eubacteriales bacterium]
MKKFTTQQITQTAVLITICIISQLFKNLSVYITGPIINTVLIIATLAISVNSALMIAIITPVTAFFITGSPIMAGIPAMFPVIMLGNAILVWCTYYCKKNIKTKAGLPIGMVVGAVVKASFMGSVTSFILFPMFGDNIASYLPKPEALQTVLAAARVTFSLTQLITALIGGVLAYLIWIPLQKFIKTEEMN